MREIRRVVAGVEIEDCAAIFDKPAGAKKYRTGVHCQDALEAGAIDQRKIKVQQLPGIQFRPHVRTESLADGVNIKREASFIDEMGSRNFGIFSSYQVNISHILDKAVDRAD
jgi:hypothetical protein